jgi:hypothetical protein
MLIERSFLGGGLESLEADFALERLSGGILSFSCQYMPRNIRRLFVQSNTYGFQLRLCNALVIAFAIATLLCFGSVAHGDCWRGSCAARVTK